MGDKQRFNVALTADFYDDQGVARYEDLGLSEFVACPAITVSRFERHLPEIEPSQLGDAQGVIVLTPKVSQRSLAESDALLAVGRFGVGYDAVDVPACTAADVLLFIAAGAVDRTVAEATVGWMIALTHRFRQKDSLVRRGEWDSRSLYMGCELRDRTLGIVGFGGIGQSLVALLTGFGMKQPLVYDPFVDPAVADRFGVKRVSLEQLLGESDFVSLHCPLNEQTRGLIGAAQLALMKPNAYLINTARGGIVDEDALYDALSSGRLAGAAIDCFVDEPIRQPPRLAELENVLLAPHCIAWTTELFRDIGVVVCRGMIDLAYGRRPRGVINPEVFDRPTFQQKWARYKLAE